MGHWEDHALGADRNPVIIVVAIGTQSTGMSLKVVALLAG
jgi:hypothetical protein